MTRIIGGVAGGRRLLTPRGSATRPTSDRVREAVFSALEARVGALSGLRVLDLYAGTGALGLEAWSRGAASVTLVEQDRRTAALITRNARDLGCRVAEVRAGAVGPFLGGRGAGPCDPYDLVLSDPPYDLPADRVAADLAALAEPSAGWLADGAVVALERSARDAGPDWPGGLRADGHRRYGETAVWYAIWYRPGAVPGTTDQQE